MLFCICRMSWYHHRFFWIIVLSMCCTEILNGVLTCPLKFHPTSFRPGKRTSSICSVVFIVIQNSFRLENTWNQVCFDYENWGNCLLTSVWFGQNTMQVKFSSPNLSSWKLNLKKPISLLHLSFAHPLLCICLLQLSPVSFWTSLSPVLRIFPFSLTLPCLRRNLILIDYP